MVSVWKMFEGKVEIVLMVYDTMSENITYTKKNSVYIWIEYLYNTFDKPFVSATHRLT